MKVFISWSGEQSRLLAQSLRQWIPDVLQAVRPWMSAADISAGARWNGEINQELSKTSFGILCLTPDNLESPWIAFEAGALAKTIDNAFVCPYLLDLEPAGIPQGPLTQFQAKRANRAETLELLQTINGVLGDKAVPSPNLERAFELWWPSLDQRIRDVAAAVPTQRESRSVPDVLADVLNEVRSISRRLAELNVSRPSAGLGFHRRSSIGRLLVALNHHPDLERSGIKVVEASIQNNGRSVAVRTPSGIVTGRFELRAVRQMDDEEFLQAVVEPLARQLLTAESSGQLSLDAGTDS